MITWNEVIKYATSGNLLPEKSVQRTKQEWQELLTPSQYKITRMKGTEAAGSGDLCYAHEAGLYTCACCDTPLFDSTIKFESGTGWPSFTQPVALNAVKYEKDTAYGVVRVEVMCNVCDGHLGHVFPDGPAPSGLRYCINSASIKLKKT